MRNFDEQTSQRFPINRALAGGRAKQSLKNIGGPGHLPAS
jgi:hypothetical protein